MEMLLQKKLAEKIYGLLSAAYFRSKYRGSDGRWRERGFDNCDPDELPETRRSVYDQGRRSKILLKRLD